MGLSFPSKPLRETTGVTAALVQPWNELMASLRDYFGRVPQTYFVDLMVRTGQTNQSAFPIEVSVPDGLRPKAVTVCYVQNLDIPETQLHTQAVFCDWRPSPTGVTIRYLTGLFSGAYAPANWKLVLKVEGD